MDYDWYHSQVLSHLTDVNTYHCQSIDNDKITRRLMTLFQQSLLTPKGIHRDTCSQCVTSVSKEWRSGKFKVPAFYIIPKLHKKPVKSRPITPSHSWVTTRISKLLDSYLQDIVKQYGHCLRNSYNIISVLEPLTFKTITLAAANVESFYTNILQNDCISNLKEMLL